MGYCPECERQYDVAHVDMCPKCKRPLWPVASGVGRKEQAAHSYNQDLAIAKGHAYQDMAIYPNASFTQNGLIHYRSAGCWCHPEIEKGEEGLWLVHHSETRN